MEAYTVLSLSSERGLTKYMCLDTSFLIEGVKVSLGNKALPAVSRADYDLLYVRWKKEKLHHWLHSCTEDYERKAAIRFLKCINEQVRPVKALPNASGVKEKCDPLFNEVKHAFEVATQLVEHDVVSAEAFEICLKELSRSSLQKMLEENFVAVAAKDLADEYLAGEFQNQLEKGL